MGGRARVGGHSQTCEELGDISRQLGEIEKLVSQKLPVVENNLKGLESRLTREISTVLQALKTIQSLDPNTFPNGSGKGSSGARKTRSALEDDPEIQEEREDGPNDLAGKLPSTVADDLRSDHMH